MRPVSAVAFAGGLWVVPVVWSVLARSSLHAVQGSGQVLCAAVLLAAAVVMFVRRDRLEMGRVR
jgi:hypothetical protein